MHHMKGIHERKLMVKIRGPFLNTIKNDSHFNLNYWKFGMATIFYCVEIETSGFRYYVLLSSPFKRGFTSYGFTFKHFELPPKPPLFGEN